MKEVGKGSIAQGPVRRLLSARFPLNTIKTPVLARNATKGLGIPNTDDSIPSDASSLHKGYGHICTQTTEQHTLEYVIHRKEDSH